MNGITKTPPAAHLPLSVPVFQILLSLCERPMHGYAILSDIHSRTDTTVELGAGTLYAAIKRMRSADMVEECDPPAAADGEDSRRRYYDITRYGREVAAAEAVIAISNAKRAAPLPSYPKIGAKSIPNNSNARSGTISKPVGEMPP